MKKRHERSDFSATFTFLTQRLKIKTTYITRLEGQDTLLICRIMLRSKPPFKVIGKNMLLILEKYRKNSTYDYLIYRCKKNILKMWNWTPFLIPNTSLYCLIQRPLSPASEVYHQKMQAIYWLVRNETKFSWNRNMKEIYVLVGDLDLHYYIKRTFWIEGNHTVTCCLSLEWMHRKFTMKVLIIIFDLLCFLSKLNGQTCETWGIKSGQFVNLLRSSDKMVKWHYTWLAELH